MTRQRRSHRHRRSGFNRKQVRAIKKIALSDIETKFEDDSATNANMLATSNNQNNLTGIVQGINQTERIGMKTKIVRLMVKADVVPLAPLSLRFYALYFPNDANVTLGALDDILPSEFYPRDTDLPKYRVLWDHTYALDANKGFTINKSMSLKNVHQSYEDATANCINGDIFVFYTTNNTSASKLSVVSNVRMLYKDA